MDDKYNKAVCSYFPLVTLYVIFTIIALNNDNNIIQNVCLGAQLIILVKGVTRANADNLPEDQWLDKEEEVTLLNKKAKRQQDYEIVSNPQFGITYPIREWGFLSQVNQIKKANPQSPIG